MCYHLFPESSHMLTVSNYSKIIFSSGLVGWSTHAYTSLAPRPMTVAFGLGTRLRVRMRTTLENGVLRNEQPSGSDVNNVFYPGNFEAMKTLSDWKLHDK